MSEKYLQINYSTPSSNNSLLSISEQGTPFNTVTHHHVMVGPNSNTFYAWIMTSDKSLTDPMSGFQDIIENSNKEVEARIVSANNMVKTNTRNLLQTEIDSCSVIYSNDVVDAFKWWEAKVTLADDYDGDIHNDITDNFTIDSSGNFSINITGVTVDESASMDYEGYTPIS